MNSLRYLTVICTRCRPILALHQRAGFKSRYTLDKIYPQSNLDITTSPKLPANDNDVFSGVIPVDQLDFTYTASSGPGGQNVNKVHTKVDLRFHVMSASWMPDSVKPKFLEKYRPMINKEGFLVLKSDRTRYRALNVADCLDKLRFMVRDAERKPKEPSDEDLATKLARHERATRERLREKRIRSAIKRDRGDD